MFGQIFFAIQSTLNHNLIMSNEENDSLPFELPAWGRSIAYVEFNSNLKALIIRLSSQYYPVYLDQEGLPLFEIPVTKKIALSENRVWSACPEFVYFSEKTSQIVVDEINSGDMPMIAPYSLRQIIKPPSFNVEVIEHLCASSFGHDDGLPPELSKLEEDFERKKVYFFNAKAVRDKRTANIVRIMKDDD